ncbi:hypothetical protein RRG08_047748 [Elysia crispata]|uniref:Uncharacterized protein n=1 Tax=Elysia crispata TaxID=231223 RepID=A0AAE1A579_9GAST|nr:hypothetical protein RRG08_047748 [Elysia crispata]
MASACDMEPRQDTNTLTHITSAWSLRTTLEFVSSILPNLWRVPIHVSGQHTRRTFEPRNRRDLSPDVVSVSVYRAVRLPARLACCCKVHAMRAAVCCTYRQRPLIMLNTTGWQQDPSCALAGVGVEVGVSSSRGQGHRDTV